MLAVREGLRERLDAHLALALVGQVRYSAVVCSNGNQAEGHNQA